MWKTTLASLRSHKRRLLGTCSAVLLGVAFLAGTMVLGDTVRAGFSDLFEDANAGTDAVVRSSSEVEADDVAQAGLLDRSLVDQLAGTTEVAKAIPEIEANGQIVGADGDPLGGNGPPTVASNWIDDSNVNPFQIAEGRAPEADHEVVIDRKSAEDGKLEVGDTATIRTPAPIDVTIVGIATVSGEDSLGPITYAGFTLEAAQKHFMPQPGQVTDVRLVAADGVSQSQLVDAVRPLLPDNAEAITGDELVQEQKDAIETDFLGFFTTFLLVFAGVALVVASFSIYNTFSIVVAQRTRESALLRALGASRRQILGSVVIEAIVVGLVASGLGLLGGLGIASALNALLASMDMELPSSSTALGTSTIIIGLAVGVVVTLLSAIAPAVKASRVPPLAAIRDVAVDRSAASRWRALAGAVVTAAGVAMTIAGATAVESLPLTGGGALALLVGIVLLGPVAAQPASGTIGRLLGRFRGMSGVLARQNAMRNPKRTASTASALLVGVAVVTMFTVLAASLKAYIDDATEDAFEGDLIIAQDNFSAVGMDPAIAEDVRELPEVGVAASFSNAPVKVDGDDEFVTAADGAELGQVMELDVSQGDLADVGVDTFAASKDYVEDQGWKLGSVVPVSFSDGATTELRLGAIFDNSDLMSGFVMSEATWAPHAIQHDLSGVIIGLADGVSMADGEAAVQSVADRYFAPDVQTREEYVDAIASQVDQMLAVIYALLVLAIIIALMGIANTLSLSIHERTREIGLLRAVGQSRRQLRSMVRGESIIVALFGTVGGLGLGCFLGWAMVNSFSGEESIDTFAIPVGQLLIVLALGAIVGRLAAMRPARRAARMDVLRAIATE